MNGDIDNVGNFGCKFDNGATNGPGTPSTLIDSFFSPEFVTSKRSA
jgi:hypothetical protein